MRIPAEKEVAMKKSILHAIENGTSVAALANKFGTSKSTIYKYRRALRDLGYIKKNENDVYVITDNKFSKRPTTPKTSNLDLSFKDEVEKEYIEVVNSHNKDLFIQNILHEAAKKEIKVAPKEKGIFQKFFGKLKKS
jgi:transposase-like protein